MCHPRLSFYDLTIIILMTVASEKQRVAEEVANMLAVSVDINSGDSLRYVEFLLAPKLLSTRTFYRH